MNRADPATRTRSWYAPAAALGFTAVTVAATFRTWETRVAPSGGLVGRSAWACGPVSAVAAAVAVLGAFAVLVAVVRPTSVPRRLLLTGSTGTLLGGALLLTGHFRPLSREVSLQPVTVAIARFSVGTSPVADFAADRVPPAAWLSVGVLGLLAVTVLASTAGTARRGRRARKGSVGLRTAASAVGTTAVVVGSIAVPWAFAVFPQADPLWQIAGPARVGAALVVLAGVLAAAATRRHRAVGTAFAALLTAAVGTGLVLPDRLPVPWRAASGWYGWYAYAPSDGAAAGSAPGRAAFLTATALVLLGSLLVLVTAAVVTRRAASAEPA